MDVLFIFEHALVKLLTTFYNYFVYFMFVKSKREGTFSSAQRNAI